MTRLTEDDAKLYPAALENLRQLIRASTTSMTSVPKPLKFMIPHFDAMKAAYEKIPAANPCKKECADVVSVLAMTMSETNETLKYKLLGNTSREEIDAWGHEYIRHLSGEIVSAWAELEAGQDAKKQDLLALVKEIVPSQMKHHAEAEACDLLMEVEQLDLLDQYVDKAAFQRVCLYLTSCVPYVPEPENTTLLETALRLFRHFGEFPQVEKFSISETKRSQIGHWTFTPEFQITIARKMPST